MSRFNGVQIPPLVADTLNLAGGEAHQESPKLELASLLLTSFVSDKFYSTAIQDMARVVALTIADRYFAAKAALFARNQFGMRSISHVVAATLGLKARGLDWLQKFFYKIAKRPDDMLEIAALYAKMLGVPANKIRPFPNAMKKGFRKRLAELDAYTLAKYKGEGKEVNMIDLINLVHPTRTEAINLLMTGKLAPAETWETKLTQAGQKATGDDDKLELKADAWRKLIYNKKLGYMALLKNLRNIVQAVPETEIITQVCEQLCNEVAIRKSLILPFRFLTALKEFEVTTPTLVKSKKDVEGIKHQRAIVSAISQACEIAVSNCPEFSGDTLIALDKSGSMESYIPTAALFAAALYKRSNAHLILFDDEVMHLTLNPSDSVTALSNIITVHCKDMGGTNFRKIFQVLKQKYDRIIIISDMQAWIGVHTPRKEYQTYVKNFCNGVRPKIFCLDMAGHGTLQFPEKDVYAVAGFSDKIFELMAQLEEDRNILIQRIEAQSF